MEDHEQQYDPEKLALLIEKQTKDILKNSKVTAAALAYYYQIPFDEAVDMPYGDAQLLVRAAQVFKAQEALQQMAIITAAIGGKKANKLISLLEKQAKW
jgi:hypothetical protein